MTPAVPQTAILITVSGRDLPGITSELTGFLAQKEAEILDIGQAVLHEQLSLSILFKTPPGDAHPKNAGSQLLRELDAKAKSLGLKLQGQLMDLEAARAHHVSSKPHHYALTLIADVISARSLHEVTAVLARASVNIESIKRLSESNFSCVEIGLSSSQAIDRGPMKKELLAIARQEGVDIALQAEGLYRRAKRLVVMDMDSTLIQNEVIDELARIHGAYDEVAAITQRAMSGEIGFDESLKLRCEKLAGMTTAQLAEVWQRIELTAGAGDLIRVLKKLGYKVALLSGGFTFVAERLKLELGIDFAYANELEIQGGRLTGKVLPPIVNAQRKADLLEVIAQQEKIDLDQVIAIGDGANDLLMLAKAGLGIAFNAKPTVREQADLSLSQRNMRSVLYLLGLSGRDLSAILPD